MIIKLWKEGKTWDEIAHEAKTSPKTISRVVDDYEQSEAFKLFERNYPPMQVRIELSMPPEKVERHYLAYRKLHDLTDFSHIYDKLGGYLPGFLNFYFMAESFNITPENMYHSLNLARDIENLKQQHSTLQAGIYETRRVCNQQAANLAGINGQTKIAADHLQRISYELNSLKLALDKVKNSNDYRTLEQMIRKTVKSLSSEQYFVFEVAVIAIMRTIQKVPSMIPLLQFPFPHELHKTAHSSFHQYTLTKVISAASKFMPEVLEELTKLTENKILPEYHKLDSKPNKEFVDQDKLEVYPNYRSEGHIDVQSTEHFDIAKTVSLPGYSEVKEKSATKDIERVFFQYDPYDTPDWDVLDASWYYMY